MELSRDLIRLTNECWVSRSLHAAVLLRLADLVGDDSVTFDELGRSTGKNIKIITAVVQLLSHRGIFSVVDGRVHQTDASQLLRRDHPGRLADVIEWMGSDEVWGTLALLPRAENTETPCFETANGAKLFEYLAQNPDRHALFDRHMEGYTRREVAAILNAVDLSPFASIADIGAGTGVLSGRIAEQYPAAHVAAFDLPGSRFRALDGNPKVELVVGDFFVDELPAADLTILANVLHDWPDAAAERILRAVRKAARPGNHLYIIEGLADAGEEKVDMVNLGMAVTTGGRQRTGEHYAQMLAPLGYTVYREVKCSEYVSVLMAKMESSSD